MTTDVAVAEFRELTPVAERRSTDLVVSAPSPMWQMVPVPQEWTRQKKVKNEEGEWELQTVPYFVDESALTQNTPKHERKRHFKGFYYTTADYARQQLTKAFGNGRYSWHETGFEVGREYKQPVKNEIKVYTEVIVEGYLLCPGYPPIYGIGSAPWAKDDVGDPRFMQATAKKAASSLALKDAAKKLGIGADIKEDDGAMAIVSGIQSTIVNLYNQLIGMNPIKKAAALKIVARFAPTALSKEVLVGEAIDEGVLDDFLAALTAEVIKP